MTCNVSLSFTEKLFFKSKILPDIIQGCEVSPEGRKKKKSIFKTYSSNNVNKVGKFKVIHFTFADFDENMVLCSLARRLLLKRKKQQTYLNK